MVSGFIPESHLREYPYSEEFSVLLGKGFVKESDIPMGHVKPVYEKIKSHSGELITVEYIHSSFNPPSFSSLLTKTFYFGVMGKDIKIPAISGWSGLRKGIIEGLESICSLDRQFENFRKIDSRNFNAPPLTNATMEWYFMNEPVGLGKYKDDFITFDELHDALNSEGGNNLEKYLAKSLGRAPRLTFYIGDEESVPFLENVLEGWQYDLLGNFLNYQMPESKIVDEKRTKEQSTLVKSFVAAEDTYLTKTTKMKKHIDDVNRQRPQDQLVDEFGIRLSEGIHVDNAKDKCLSILRTAKLRDYLKYGREILVNERPGFNHDINVAKFFREAGRRFEFDF